MREYLELMTRVLTEGSPKGNRTGIATVSSFAENYKVDLRNGFPLLTTKEIPWKSIVIENLWFLGGSSSPDFLHKHGVNFWNPWIEQDGNLPKAYGEFWRSYPDVINVEPECNYSHLDFQDQIACFDQFEAIVDGLKKDPNDRRLVLTNWYPPSAWSAKLPPCHLMAIFNVQYHRNCDTGLGEPHLNLHLTQRSCDVPVGIPFNLAGYAFILELVAHLTGLESRIFAHTLVDAHIYDNQMDGVIEQLTREPTILPRLKISKDINTLADIDALIKDGTTEQIMEAFKIEGYNSQPRIKFPVAV